ncbi:MAG: TetR/AcrR family transcriptional regulator [Sphingomonadaceae bacterium]|nr:TetR/AcrR family transcriptional regulator [Sphingobium sp.]MBP9158956.1 TetR/AcrR family transcriptional regulator [Sphingobium sp.]MCC6482512.1 TetR/AcrR family transcriptional regulator [Sphingomonadaceae bacterium]
MNQFLSDDNGANISPRDRIILAAEKLFAAKGLHGAGLREIAREANVNVNLIGYHFSNKETLYRHVHETRAKHINTMREQALEALDRTYAPGLPPVEQIIRAFIHPFFVLKSENPDIWVAFIRTYFREIGTDVWREVNATTLAPAIRRFTDVLHRSLPTTERSDILFVLGLAIHGAVMAADADEAAIVGEGLAADLTPDELEERLVRALTIIAQQYS